MPSLLGAEERQQDKDKRENMRAVNTTPVCVSIACVIYSHKGVMMLRYNDVRYQVLHNAAVVHT